MNWGRDVMEQVIHATTPNNLETFPAPVEVVKALPVL